MSNSTGKIYLKNSRKHISLCACISIISVAIIIIYIFSKGTPAIFKIGFIDFLFGTSWVPFTRGIWHISNDNCFSLGTLGAIIIGGQ